MGRVLSIILPCSIIISFIEAQNTFCLNFDGDGDHVTVLDASALIANSEQLSITGWVYPRNANSGWPDFDGFFGFRNESDADFYLLQLDNYKVEGRLRISLNDYFTVVTDENSISFETWVHLALTYDGNDLIVYINGIGSGSTVASGEITNESVPLEVGRLAFQNTFFDLDGQVDEIGLWNVALTEQEVQDYMFADLTGEEGLIGYWNFNEGSGGTANDASGNGNYGTISNATWSTDVPGSLGSPTVIINEFLASNNSCCTDENGDYDDYIEIFNPGDEPADIGGLFITNALGNVNEYYQIPSGNDSTIIDPGGFLLLWADEESEQGVLHLGIELGSSDGDQIGLYLVDLTTVVDTLTYIEQTADVSFGNYPDGSGYWLYLNPTPGTSNTLLSMDHGYSMPEIYSLYQNFPNPFNPVTTLHYDLPEGSYVDIIVYDMLGNVVNNLVKANQSSGYKSVQWNAINNQGEPVSAGVYLYSIEAGDFRQTKKMILLK
jgi:hypothetical protein